MRTLIAAAAIAVAVVVVVLATRHAKSPTIPPVPHAQTAAQEAQNLEAWLRNYSR